MAVSVPGLSLSILRQQTTVQSGLPLLVSGRFTAFGLGVPAFIRVFLEGPSYDPKLRSFDTFASPFSGDYTVNVIAEKDGRYDVYAQASPPPLIPTGPPFPEAIMLLPPLAESTRPPLVVGYPFNGGVDALMPDGTSQRLTAPPMQPIEFRPVITVAPGITVTAPGVPAAYPGIPAYPLPAPPPVAPPAAPPERITGAIADIRMSPDTINPGQEATGVISWSNTGPAPHSFDLVLYLVDAAGGRYGPLQLEQNLRASPQVPQVTNLRMGTEGLRSGSYSVLGELYDSVTGQLLLSNVVPYRLAIREIAPPAVPPLPPAPPVPLPPAPPVPPPPVVPAVPTVDILGSPSLNLPRQINVGDIWSGSVSLPTFGTIPYFAEAHLMLRDPTGAEYSVGQGGRSLQPGETLQVPVNFDTSGYPGGNYTILLRVFDQAGLRIAEFPMGLLSMIAAIVPPFPPVPGVPTLPTANMFDTTPSIFLPSEVEIGEIWQGDITVPTLVPPALQALPSLPSFPVDIGLQLQNPAGQLFDVGNYRPSFTPGEPLSLPVNFDTRVLPTEGIHNLIMNITDLQGNTLFSNVIGTLRALMPALPPAPPGVLPTRFPDINVNLGPSEVEWGDVLRVPVTYTHDGDAEEVTLYAAIGNWGAWGFDEVLHASKTINPGLDLGVTRHQDYVDIPITTAVGPGFYDVYAKITGRRQVGPVPVGETISPPIEQVVQVLAPPVPLAPPAPPALSQFTSIRVNISPQQVEEGDELRVPVSIIHVGAAEDVTLYAAIGQIRLIEGFDEILRGSKGISVPRDEAPTARGDEVIIPITPAIQPGTYSVYAKITGKIPQTVSETVRDVIEVIGPPVVPRSQFPSCSVDIGRQRLEVGDTLTVPVRFVHSGEREMVRVYAAIGNWGAAGFDEILHGQTDWATPDDLTPQARTVNVPISITSAIRPGTYDVYGKVVRVQTGLGETVSAPVQNIIEIAAPVPVGPSVFSQVTVGYPTPAVSIGESLRLQVNFMHQGEAESEWLHAAVGNDGVFGFDEILSNRRAITVPAEAEATYHSEFIDIPITSAISPGTYDVYAKIGLGVRPRAISSTTHDVIRVVS